MPQTMYLLIFFLYNENGQCLSFYPKIKDVGNNNL